MGLIAPALCPAQDHLPGDADGDLRRCHRLDSGANGSVDLCDGFLRDARLPQPPVHGGGLGAGADDPHIGKRPTEDLFLHLEVVHMTVGHDDHEVLLRHREVVLDGGEAPTDDLLCRGEELAGGQLRAAVEHHRAEAHRYQQGTQGLRDVARPEQQRPLPDGQGHTEQAILPDAVGLERSALSFSAIYADNKDIFAINSLIVLVADCSISISKFILHPNIRISLIEMNVHNMLLKDNRNEMT